MDYEKEADLIIQVILEAQRQMHKSVDNAANEYFNGFKGIPPTNQKLKSLSNALEKNLGENFFLIAAEEFPPFQKLMLLHDELKKRFGEMYITVMEQGYNTKRGDEVELLLPEDRWTDNTRKIYSTLVKTAIELLKQDKLKPLKK